MPVNRPYPGRNDQKILLRSLRSIRQRVTSFYAESNDIHYSATIIEDLHTNKVNVYHRDLDTQTKNTYLYLIWLLRTFDNNLFIYTLSNHLQLNL